MLSESFALLQQEGFLTRSSLLAGFNSLRKANVDDINKGFFYSAFFELSIGLERLMKLVIVIDYMSKNNLAPMTDEELKNKYGHRIESLYIACKKLSTEMNRPNENFFDQADFEWNIIHFLHEFALSSRYYNLSKLSNKHKSNDPLKEWWDILICIIHSDLTQKRLENIHSNSLQYCDELGGNQFTLMRGLHGQLMTTLDAIMDPQLVAAAAPYSVWRVFTILQPFYHLLSNVVEAAHKIEIEKGINYPLIPYMDEFFPFLLLPKSIVIKRRKWG